MTLLATEILCEKLNHYGVHGDVNKLIKSYLANRRQYVSLNGFDFEKKNIDCGVPQGSSLGPLFTSYEILNKIEVLQKKCLRIITFSDSSTHTNPLFINLKLLKVKDLIKLHQLKLVFEFCEQVIPTSLFTFSSEMHTTNLVLKSARKNLLYMPAIKTTTYGYRSMKFHCSKLWNDTFKKRIAIDGFG